MREDKSRHLHECTSTRQIFVINNRLNRKQLHVKIQIGTFSISAGTFESQNLIMAILTATLPCRMTHNLDCELTVNRFRGEFIKIMVTDPIDYSSIISYRDKV